MGGWYGGVEWMDGWMDGWKDGWTDGWTDGRTDGWMDGWMDGYARHTTLNMFFEHLFAFKSARLIGAPP